MATAKVKAIEVLFVDDDPFGVAKYREALEAEFKVHFIKRAVEVISFLQENLQVRAVVLDIMMPPEREDDNDQLGLNTGLTLIQEMRSLETWPFPVLLLTNRKPITVEADLCKLGLESKHIQACQKAQTDPVDLPGLVEEMFGDMGGRKNE